MTEDQHPDDLKAAGRKDADDRRWRLIADVTVFQGKLLLDGVRDLVLSPVSLGAAILGIATSRDDPGRYFYRLMGWGRWTDGAINLFNAKGTPEGEPGDARHQQGPSVDQLADELERALIDRYTQSSFAKAAKDSIDKSLDRMNTAPSFDREQLRAAARRILRALERSKPRRGGAPRRSQASAPLPGDARPSTGTARE